MRSARLVAVLLVVSASAAWAASGSSHDGALAQRLVISKNDARPLFPGAWGHCGAVPARSQPRRQTQ